MPQNFFSIVLKKSSCCQRGLVSIKSQLNFRPDFKMKLSLSAVLALSSSVAAFQPTSLRTTSSLRSVRLNAVALPVFEGIASSLKREKKDEQGGPTVDMTGIMLSVS
jgi:hypothetical protein